MLPRRIQRKIAKAAPINISDQLKTTQRITMLTFVAYRDFICAARVAALSSDSEWDGRAIWQPTKNALSAEPEGLQWSDRIRDDARMSLYRDVMGTLPEFNPDGSTNELSHFMIQCVRIPMIDFASPRKVQQIALNIGQLEAEVQLGNVVGPALALYERFIALGMLEMKAYV